MVKDTLKNMIIRKRNEADLQRGKSSTPIELSGGLRFVIRRDTGKYTIYLSRAGLTPPSSAEIDTFLNEWGSPGLMPENPRAGVTFEISEWRA